MRTDGWQRVAVRGAGGRESVGIVVVRHDVDVVCVELAEVAVELPAGAFCVPCGELQGDEGLAALLGPEPADRRAHSVRMAAPVEVANAATVRLEDVLGIQARVPPRGQAQAADAPERAELGESRGVLDGLAEWHVFLLEHTKRDSLEFSVSYRRPRRSGIKRVPTDPDRVSRCLACRSKCLLGAVAQRSNSRVLDRICVLP